MPDKITDKDIEFGKYIKKLRDERNLSLRQVDLYSGVSNSYLSMLENGKRKIPSPDVLKKLAEAYKVDYNQLMEKAGYIDRGVVYAPTYFESPDVGDRVVCEGLASYSKEELENFRVITSKNNLVKIPILGVIRAGEPILAEENIIGYEYEDKKELNGDEYFYLRVTGDSMNKSRIQEGDLVLVRRQSDVDSGDIAVVLVGDEEATLKKIMKVDGVIVLQPDSYNPIHKPRIISKDENIRILGKVIHAKIKF